MNPLRVVAGIDGGSTKTRVQVRCADSFALLAEAKTTGSTNLYQHGADGPEAVAALLDGLLNTCLAPNHALVSAVLGTAGIDAHGDADRHLAACRRSQALCLPTTLLHVCSDVEPIDVFGTKPHRVCVIAGTGSNTLALRREDGHIVARHQVGGMDLALSDNGSGAWIGHHAMRAALCDLQHVEASALGDAVLEHFDLPRDKREPWRALRDVRLRISKAELAALTTALVVPLSVKDAVARRLLNQAGELLAQDILAAARAIEAPSSLEILAVGGVWSSKVVRDEVTRRVVSAHTHATLTTVDPAEGAARLAQRRLAER